MNYGTDNNPELISKRFQRRSVSLKSYRDAESGVLHLDKWKFLPKEPREGSSRILVQPQREDELHSSNRRTSPPPRTPLIITKGSGNDTPRKMRLLAPAPSFEYSRRPETPPSDDRYDPFRGRDAPALPHILPSSLTGDRTSYDGESPREYNSTLFQFDVQDLTDVPPELNSRDVGAVVHKRPSEPLSQSMFTTKSMKPQNTPYTPYVYKSKYKT
ncbi:hypothetical protein PROFUN_05113 [Planoprotostelium fungivorum]|uniref:Uncharacterized protein n=1 Tax=Planoprotostelium fungivorum TaxID=1890364 RepID=A0A2P6NRP3_9EUKA|nr:hypothetical protein PROFUN_05113 [Planoprotostelium fungivorum]